MKQLHNINGPLGVLMSEGKPKSKRCVLRRFLKVETEVAEQTDST